MWWIRGVALAIAWLAIQGAAHAVPITFSATGTTAADIQAQVDAFRAALGTLNPNVAGSFGSGRREINWDGVPDALSAPNDLPANFFNVNSPRGVIFATPGTGFQVSGNPAVGAPPEFSNINAGYPALFTIFSAPRLFTALGSTITDVQFFVPGTTIPALTSGFGAVFTDVDLVNTTSLQFFDAANNSLGTFFVPPLSGNETLEFLGLDFGSALISHVLITSGNTALGPNETGAIDLVVMDDFIYGEPIPVPEPASLLLFGSALLGFGILRRRKQRRTEAGSGCAHPL
jgi:hypothetical protein